MTPFVEMKRRLCSGGLGDPAQMMSGCAGSRFIVIDDRRSLATGSVEAEVIVHRCHITLNWYFGSY